MENKNNNYNLFLNKLHNKLMQKTKMIQRKYLLLPNSMCIQIDPKGMIFVKWIEIDNDCDRQKIETNNSSNFKVRFIIR